MGHRGDAEHRTDETLIKNQVNISGGAGLQVCRETLQIRWLWKEATARVAGVLCD